MDIQTNIGVMVLKIWIYFIDYKEVVALYLEKFYDSNKTYSKYNIDDVLPYRIENVNLITKRKQHSDTICEFDENTKIYYQ